MRFYKWDITISKRHPTGMIKTTTDETKLEKKKVWEAIEQTAMKAIGDCSRLSIQITRAYLHGLYSIAGAHHHCVTAAEMDTTIRNLRRRLKKLKKVIDEDASNTLDEIRAND